MASQSQFGKWSVQRRINTGGQADFYSVIDSTQFLDDSQLKTLAMQAFDELNKNRDVGIRHLQTVIKDVIARESANLKALKHIRSKSNKAQSRFAEEIRLLTEIQHAALIPLVDSNVEQRWFVTDHYPATLSDALAAYKNRGLATLQAIQPIVEAVGRLHSKGVIHRDIKPDNIYRTAKGNLVLGDFGIAIDVSEEEASHGVPGTGR